MEWGGDGVGRMQLESWGAMGYQVGVARGWGGEGVRYTLDGVGLGRGHGRQELGWGKAKTTALQQHEGDAVGYQRKQSLVFGNTKLSCAHQ